MSAYFFFENENLPTSTDLHQFGFENNDNFVWNVSQSISANCNGLNAGVFNNYSGFIEDNPSDTRDGLITPSLNFSTAK